MWLFHDSEVEPDWESAALLAVQVCCLSFPEFSSDDVWDGLGGFGPGEKRRMGLVMRRAAGLGWCRMIGARRSRLEGCHAHLSVLWASRLWKGGVNGTGGY